VAHGWVYATLGGRRKVTATAASDELHFVYICHYQCILTAECVSADQ